LLRKIRDEVHRFSITFHRQKRKSTFLKSSLDDIKGLGTKRVQSIWVHYDSIENFLDDSNENIKKNTLLSLKLIKKIKEIKRKK